MKNISKANDQGSGVRGQNDGFAGLWGYGVMGLWGYDVTAKTDHDQKVLMPMDW
jgi:hypothetical protein